jgi:CDP-diacylglycerol---serine O-phosphatidyltransferase
MNGSAPIEAFDRRNLITYVSLLCGVAAIEAALAGHARAALALVALSVVADTLDGRFARLFGDDPDRKALGVQLDSLADAIAFGIAPVAAAGAAIRPGSEHGGWWIAAAFVYAACAITRLGFYNVSPDAERSSAFVGVPVPVAALLLASVSAIGLPLPVMVAVTVACASLMVLPLRIARPRGAGLLLFLCWPLAVAAVLLWQQ